MSEQTQVDLDLEGEEEALVDLPGSEEVEDTAVEDTPVEDNYEKAENSTQKRINRLTKKMRESERQSDAALSYAQEIQKENEALKQRLNALDNNYVDQYSGRVESELAQAESELAQAVELADSKAVVAAQRKLTNLAIEADRANQAKNRQKAQQEQVQAAPAQAAAPAIQQPQQPARPDPKAEAWASKNSWFGENEAMTYAAFGIHKKLIEEEGFDPQSDDYYNELDRQIATAFNTQPEESATVVDTGKRPAQTVAGATRTKKSGRSGKKVRLTPSQVAIAKKLGVPLEEYAKHVKE